MLQIAVDIVLLEYGLDIDRVDLVRALLIALEQPDSLERWLQGERVFESARITFPMMVSATEVVRMAVMNHGIEQAASTKRELAT